MSGLSWRACSKGPDELGSSYDNRALHSDTPRRESFLLPGLRIFHLRWTAALVRLFECSEMAGSPFGGASLLAEQPSQAPA